MQDKVWDFSTKKFTSRKNVLENLFTHHLKYYSIFSTYTSF